MGGSAFPIAETTNYRWYFWERHGGEFTTYSLECQRKKDDAEVQIRSYGYSCDEKDDECDKAYDELEKEWDCHSNYKALTKQQVTLAEMWKRMTEAESGYARLKSRNDELEGVINTLHKVARRD